MKAEWSTDPDELAGYANREVESKPPQVGDAVDSLPKPLAAVINALYWEGLSYPAAIAALKISPATFFRRLAEAKRRLRQVLEEDTVGSLPAADEGQAVLVPQAG